MNPLRGISNRREVLSWGSFDLANQSFTLIINTLLFGIFVKEVVMAGHESGKLVWGLMGSASLAVVAIGGPMVGAFADARGCKKKILVSTGCLCALLTMGLSLLPSSATTGLPLALLFALLLYIPANIAFNLGENFLASFLPEIADRENMGKISAFGWTMGYLGSLILLIGLIVAAFVFGLKEAHQFRPLLFFAGLWFALLMIPTILYLPENKPTTRAASEKGSLRKALAQFRSSFREASRFRDLSALLGSFFLYGMGVQVIIYFAGMIAEDGFGFEMSQLFIFSVIVTLSGGVGAIITGRLQDRLGHKATLLGFIALWAFVALGLLGLSWLRSSLGESFPDWPVWLVGGFLGLALGGIGTATRAAVGVLTPTQRTAEFFGLWGTTGKLAGVVGLPIFGWVWFKLGSVPSLAVLTTFFLAGATLIWRRLDMDRGIDTAREVEALYAEEALDASPQSPRS